MINPSDPEHKLCEICGRNTFANTNGTSMCPQCEVGLLEANLTLATRESVQLREELADLRRERDRLRRLLAQVMEERRKWSEPQPLPDRLAEEIHTVLHGGEPPSSAAPSSEDRRGYERAVEELTDEAVRNLAEAASRVWYTERDSTTDHMPEWQAWKAVVRAVLAAQGEGRGK